MTWFGIIKNTKLRAGSKVTTNLGIDSKQEEDGPCKRKVEEYIKKVIEYSKKQYLYMQTIPVSHKIIEEGTRNLSEEVCCKILELLNRVKPTQFLTKRMKVNDATYLIKVNYQNTDWGGATMKVEVRYDDDLILLFGLHHQRHIGEGEGDFSKEEMLKAVDFR